MKMKQFIGKVKLGAIRKAPELMLGGALITGTACVITTGKSAYKAHGIVINYNDERAAIAQKSLCTDDRETAKDEIRKLYLHTGLELAKTYAVPFTLYAATIAFVMGSYTIQKKRMKALSATLASVSASYAALVAKLKNGAEHGLTAKEVLDGVEVNTSVDENGNVVEEKVQGDPVETSPYKFRFDKYSINWEKDKFQNQCTLISEENWANDVLSLQGYLFLNDVLDRLGIPRTKAGQIVGWVKNGEGDGYVSFGTFDCSKYEDIRYDENAFDLEFNCDGDILCKFN